MNEQIDQNENEDTEAHLYIPKDERAGSATDAEGHKHRFKGVDEAGEDDTITDAEGHKRQRRLDDADEGDTITHAEGHKRRGLRLDDADEDDMITDTEGHKRYRRLDDADEGEMLADAEGHGLTAPADAVDEPTAVRGRDAKGRR